MTGLGSIDPETVSPMLRGLERYRVGDGYGAFPGDRNRYYDDNAWIALDRLQLAILRGETSEVDAAASVFGLLRKGEAASGGVYWVEGEASRNTCSTGPAAQVALRLHLATGEQHYLEFAQRQMAFLDGTLRDDEGLYRDHVRPDETIEPTIWSYNQGTPIGAAVLLARITGDQSWIERAHAHGHQRGRPLRARRRLVAGPAGLQRDLLPQSAGPSGGRARCVVVADARRLSGASVDRGAASSDGTVRRRRYRELRREPDDRPRRAHPALRLSGLVRRALGGHLLVVVAPDNLTRRQMWARRGDAGLPDQGRDRGGRHGRTGPRRRRGRARRSHRRRR